MRPPSLAALLLSSGFVIACGSEPKPPPASPSGETQEPKATAKHDTEKPGDIPTQSQINISEEIRKACGIKDSDAFFAFDSSQVRDTDEKVLVQLAKCFMDGPLKGREMRLVGHADPRGEPEYNMVLGGKRADNVAEYLVTKGLKRAQVNTTSRGEMDATGTDEASWSKDRRVDIMLAD